MPLRFAATIERSFVGLVDLDSAADHPFPEGESAVDFLEDDSPSFSAARDKGIDAVALAGGLRNLGTRFASIGEAEWETITPQQVIDSVYKGLVVPQTLEPTGEFGTGHTFSYQTNEGGFGLFQFLPPRRNESGVTLRIRQIQR